MNPEYFYYYKKAGSFFWRKQLVIGHKLDSGLDRMILFLKDGGQISLASWSKYDTKLGQDWFVAVKRKMEQEAGQPIRTTVDAA